MNDKPKVCAVVVSYNRKDLLIECLEALLKQTRPIEGIYVIDNASTDGTPGLLKERRYITEIPPDNLREPWEKEFEVENLTDKNKVRIYYVRMDKNTGGAGGFYEGVKRGYERGYDWLWLMDDDAEPKVDALEKLLPYTNGKYMVLSNLKIGIDGIPQYIHRGWKDICNINGRVIRVIKQDDICKETIEIDHSSFVGFMISRDAINIVGFPNRDFFVHYDDVEYSFRIRNYGKILLIRDSVIKHKDETKKILKEAKLLFIKPSITIPYESLWIKYYSLRNLIHLKCKYCSFFVALIVGLRIFIRSSLGIILRDDHKYRRIKFYFNAILDGILGIFDNNKPKKILYK